MTVGKVRLCYTGKHYRWDLLECISLLTVYSFPQYVKFVSTYLLNIVINMHLQ